MHSIKENKNTFLLTSATVLWWLSYWISANSKSTQRSFIYLFLTNFLLLDLNDPIIKFHQNYYQYARQMSLRYFLLSLDLLNWKVLTSKSSIKIKNSFFFRISLKNYILNRIFNHYANLSFLRTTNKSSFPNSTWNLIYIFNKNFFLPSTNFNCN